MTSSSRPAQRRSSAPVTVGFQGGGDFYAELKTRVRRYLADPRPHRRAQLRMYLKSAAIVAWLIASGRCWCSSPPPGGRPRLLAVSLGLALAGIGFNVTHDANHGGYSPHRRLNRACAVAST